MELTKEAGEPAGRVATHGRVEDTSRAYEALCRAFATSIRGPAVPTYLTYPLDMILVKLARIAAGDPAYADHWRDIAGYASLAASQIEAKSAPPVTAAKVTPADLKADGAARAIHKQPPYKPVGEAPTLDELAKRANQAGPDYSRMTASEIIAHRERERDAAYRDYASGD